MHEKKCEQQDLISNLRNFFHKKLTVTKFRTCITKKKKKKGEGINRHKNNCFSFYPSVNIVVFCFIIGPWVSGPKCLTKNLKDNRTHLDKFWHMSGGV